MLKKKNFLIVKKIGSGQKKILIFSDKKIYYQLIIESTSSRIQTIVKIN